MAEMHESLFDSGQLINAMGGAEYLEQSLNKTSKAFNRYLDVRQRRMARKEFHNNNAPYMPSALAEDLRDSWNVNGPLQTLQQTKFEIMKNTSHATQPFQASGQQFESYYNYLQRQNQTYQLTYNNTQMAQQIHQYNATSSSNHIQQQMRKMSPKPTQYRGQPLHPWQWYNPF